MKLQIYSIYDKKAQLYARPFFLQNDLVAVRALISNATDETHMKKFPDDYVLFKLGSFNESDGTIDSLIHPELVQEMRVIYDAFNNDLDQQSRAESIKHSAQHNKL